VSVFVVSNVLSSVVNFTTTEELLLRGLAFVVKNHAKSGSHVDSLSLAVKFNVLTRICRAVTEDVIKSVGLLGLLGARLVVAVGLSNLADPRADSHELLSLASLFSSEEIIFGLVILTVLNLVVASSLGVVLKSLLVGLTAKISIVIVATGATFDLKSDVKQLVTAYIHVTRSATHLLSLFLFYLST